MDMDEKLNQDNVIFTGLIKPVDVTLTVNCIICDEQIDVYPITCNDYIVTGFGVTKICDKCRNAILKMREEMEE